MPPAAIGAVAAAEITATAVAAAIGKIMIGLAISQMFSSIAQSIAGTEGAGDRQAEGVRETFCSTQVPIPVVYGENKIGGNDIYKGVSGGENSNLWMVQSLSEGECQGLKTVIDEKGNSVGAAYLGEKLYTWYMYGGTVPCAFYTFHSGSRTQAVDAEMNTNIPAWTDAMRGMSYIIWRLVYNSSVFQSIPERRVILLGKIVYDFRDGIWKYSNNPVLCLYDYMTAKRYGLGYASTRFDLVSWTSAANYCDEKGWVLNTVLREPKQARENVDNILAHFRGGLTWWEGKWYLRYRDMNYESSVMTVEDRHICQDSNGKALIRMSQPPRSAKPAGLRVKFYDPDKDYALDDVPVGDTQGEVREFQCLGAGSRKNAINIGNYNLERMKLDRMVSGTFRDDCIKLENEDLITLTSQALGIEDSPMRVIESNIRSDGMIDLVMQIENEELYDDDLDTLIDTRYRSSLPNPAETPPTVQNVRVSETGFDYRLRTFTKLSISFDAPASYPWFRGVNVWRSNDNINWTFAFFSNASFEIENVQEGENYYFSLCTVNIWGIAQTLEQGYRIYRKITGHNDVPSSLSALQIIPNDNSIVLMAIPVDESDIESYEFRFGSSWSGGIFLASTLKPFYSLKGVRPGTHTFWCNTRGNNGTYGSTPRSASCIIIVPKGWTLLDSDTCNYNGVGTHDNTEHTTYGGDDYLKCSHTSGGGLVQRAKFKDRDTFTWQDRSSQVAWDKSVMTAGDVDLTGVYLSPEFDLGSSQTALIYLEAGLSVTGEGTTWADKFPSPTTWRQGGALEKTWRQIFELTESPSVQIRIYYGATSGNLTNYVDRMEVLSAVVTGRYFQVEITLTDPNINVNALMEHFTLKYLT